MSIASRRSSTQLGQEGLRGDQVCEGRAEQGHVSVAHDLVDGALVVMDGFHHPLEDGIEEDPRLLGVAIGEESPSSPFGSAKSTVTCWRSPLEGRAGVLDAPGQMRRGAACGAGPGGAAVGAPSRARAWPHPRQNLPPVGVDR
jgi:hypothetical protein